MVKVMVRVRVRVQTVVQQYMSTLINKYFDLMRTGKEQMIIKMATCNIINIK